MEKRFKNVNWSFTTASNGDIQTWEQVHAAVLMDIRDELQRLNTLLHCQNFQRIPAKLDSIRTATNRIDKRLATKSPL